ncbi:MAG: hypothetical protein JW834_05030 [Candidatus Diapherotrites archaeon]|nr:hypothetical protein [Candidatus Diapherotrites archaeon]
MPLKKRSRPEHARDSFGQLLATFELVSKPLKPYRTLSRSYIRSNYRLNTNVVLRKIAEAGKMRAELSAYRHELLSSLAMEIGEASKDAPAAMLPRAVDVLVKAVPGKSFDDSQRGSVYAVFSALSRISRRHDGALKPLVDGLRSRREVVACIAAIHLGETGRVESIPHLVRALDSRSADVSAAAARALGRLSHSVDGGHWSAVESRLEGVLRGRAVFWKCLFRPDEFSVADAARGALKDIRVARASLAKSKASI